METREEQLATWADPTSHLQHTIRILDGTVSLLQQNPYKCTRITEKTANFDQLEEQVLDNSCEDSNNKTQSTSSWHFKVISLPRLRPGRLFLSVPKQTFQQIRDSWDLHPRTLEVFLSNNGVLCTSYLPNAGRASLVLKVANSRATGFDCVSVSFDLARRTTYVLYHHLQDEASVFATLLSAPARCIDYLFFVAALYRSHNQHIEAQRNTLDDAIKIIERQTGFGNPGLLSTGCRSELERPLVADDPKRTLRQLSYCQTDLAILGHAARCALDCGGWLLQAVDETSPEERPPSGRGGEPRRRASLYPPDQHFLTSLRAARSWIREDVEYTRRRAVTAVSQLQQIRGRVESQTSFVSFLFSTLPWFERNQTTHTFDD